VATKAALNEEKQAKILTRCQREVLKKGPSVARDAQGFGKANGSQRAILEKANGKQRAKASKVGIWEKLIKPNVQLPYSLERSDQDP
jgi:hypothetical protein